MKKRIILTLLCVSTLMSEAHVIVPFFTAMKEEILPYIDVKSRKQMVELYEAQKRAVISNKLSKSSELKELRDNYLKIQLSDFSSFEMAVFQYQSDNYIVTINTSGVGSTAASIVTVYTGSWTKIGTAKRFPPKVTEKGYKTLFAKDEVRKNNYMGLIQSAVSYSVNAEEMCVQQRCFFEWLSPNQTQDTLTVTTNIDIKTALK